MRGPIGRVSEKCFPGSGHSRGEEIQRRYLFRACRQQEPYSAFALDVRPFARCCLVNNMRGESPFFSFRKRKAVAT